MQALGETHRNTRESAPDEKYSELLCCGRRRPVWIYVNHLPGAIDDHSEPGHFVCSEQTVEVRSTNSVDVTFVSDRDRHVHECAIAHPQTRELAGAVMLLSPSPDAN